MDSDGDLFIVEERVLWSYKPGNALLTWPAIWLSAVIKMNFIYKIILIIV